MKYINTLNILFKLYLSSLTYLQPLLQSVTFTCTFVLTIGRSLRICIPSPGPICAMWLKLVGLEINLFLISGSRSISLEEKILCLDISLEMRMDIHKKTCTVLIVSYF